VARWRRAAKGPRKKRTRPEPRQYTVADLERARDRVAAAQRRIDSDRRSTPNRGTCGVGAGAARTVRRRVATTACPAFLNDGSIELSRHPGEHVEGPRGGYTTVADLLRRPAHRNLVPILLQKSAIRRARRLK
jgi:hypothetical protein